ncbi:hypothetical protein [Aquicella siphonis]|uniref:hypothetical protein n=1 Tax=Aquicella siphonis TaxID=254247 RepID=UPI0011DE11D3|nr:hypothetical protein [Aquicella siphonis]
MMALITVCENHPDQEFVKYLKAAIGQICYLHAAYIKEGASSEMILDDLTCIAQLISTQPPVQCVTRLHQQIGLHESAASTRRGWGITSAVTGGGLLVTSGASVFFSLGLSAPVLIGLSFFGATLLPTGTGVAMDATRKRGDLASCERELLNYVLQTFRTNDKYHLYVQYQLSIILSDAQARGHNRVRDQLIEITLEQLNDSNDLSALSNKLDDLVANLKGNSSNSKTAVAIKTLLDDVNLIKRNGQLNMM